MKIEFTEETQVNNAKIKKGEVLNFTDSVAQSFIEAGKAKEVKPESKKKEDK